MHWTFKRQTDLRATETLSVAGFGNFRAQISAARLPCEGLYVWAEFSPTAVLVWNSIPRKSSALTEKHPQGCDDAALATQCN